MGRLLCLIGLHDWYVMRFHATGRPVQCCRRPLCEETWRWGR